MDFILFGYTLFLCIFFKSIDKNYFRQFLINPIKPLVYLVIISRWRVFNFTGRSPDPTFLHARHRLDEVPGAFEEEIVVIIQGVHR